jgi:ribosomal protein S18 acetylase RimI-like enzyme
MTETIMIRDWRADDDVERLVQIAVAAWEPIYAQFRRTMGDGMFLALHPDWPAEKGGQVQRACESGSSANVCVAEQAGELVGFITYYIRHDPCVAEIGNNAVHPAWQGQGIGPRMYEYVFERLRQRGVQYVQVHTGGDPSHAPARRAYEKAGFQTQLPEVTYFRKL